ncbi:hypothetical protein CDIK_2615 [Cucumispora dikerogammari]|nr:hypothetical protein CDIK_2615 [Cucumispora dikerogammari]
MKIKLSTRQGSYLKLLMTSIFFEQLYYHFIVSLVISTLSDYYLYDRDSINNILPNLNYIFGTGSLLSGFFCNLVLGKFYTLYLSLSLYNACSIFLIYSNLLKSPKKYIYCLYMITFCSGMIKISILNYGYTKSVYMTNVLYFIVNYYFYSNLSKIFVSLSKTFLLRFAGYSVTYLLFTAVLHICLAIVYSVENSYSATISSENNNSTNDNNQKIAKFIDKTNYNIMNNIVVDKKALQEIVVDKLVPSTSSILYIILTIALIVIGKEPADNLLCNNIVENMTNYNSLPVLTDESADIKRSNKLTKDFDYDENIKYFINTTSYYWEPPVADYKLSSFAPVINNTGFKKTLKHCITPIIIMILCSTFKYKINMINGKFMIGCVFSFVVSILVLVYNFCFKYNVWYINSALYVVIYIGSLFSGLFFTVTGCFLIYRHSASNRECLWLGGIFFARGIKFLMFKNLLSVSFIKRNKDIFCASCGLIGIIVYLVKFGRVVLLEDDLNLWNKLFGN